MVIAVVVSPLNLLISSVPYFHPSLHSESAYKEASCSSVLVKPHM